MTVPRPERQSMLLCIMNAIMRVIVSMMLIMGIINTMLIMMVIPMVRGA